MGETRALAPQLKRAFARLTSWDRRGDAGPAQGARGNTKTAKRNPAGPCNRSIPDREEGTNVAQMASIRRGIGGLRPGSCRLLEGVRVTKYTFGMRRYPASPLPRPTLPLRRDEEPVDIRAVLVDRLSRASPFVRRGASPSAPMPGARSGLVGFQSLKAASPVAIARRPGVEGLDVSGASQYTGLRANRSRA